jgi:kynurenine formamidase
VQTGFLRGAAAAFAIGAATVAADDDLAARIAAAELVDLTHPFDAHTIYWPTDTRGFQLETVAEGDTEGGWFYAAKAFCTAEHGGTHLDAPYHFDRGGDAVDGIPLTRLVAPGVVIDVTDAAAADPDYRLAVADIERHEARHGPIPRGSIVLLQTGWSARWPDVRAYLGDDTAGDASRLSFPGYGMEAAQLLVADRGVAAMGIDTASLDHGRSTDFPVHRVAAAAQVPGLENLTGLDALPPTGFTVIALPMKIAGGSGAPVRVIALVEP